LCHISNSVERLWCFDDGFAIDIFWTFFRVLLVNYFGAEIYAENAIAVPSGLADLGRTYDEIYARICSRAHCLQDHKQRRVERGYVIEPTQNKSNRILQNGNTEHREHGTVDSTVSNLCVKVCTYYKKMIEKESRASNNSPINQKSSPS
jgi:lysine/ornithine N-monooxygenase